MNGAVFGTFKIIRNSGKMICGRNNHPWYKQMLMFLYMIYLMTLFILQFLAISAVFVAITIIYDQFSEQLFAS
jgi:hypothetical protein